tara:strand:- start:292 stop:933 length:642 start_codon:yes stop_codon:yes gene_type:complete
MKKPSYWNKAKKHLSKKDKVMKKLILTYKDVTLTTRRDIFFSLVKAVCGQQLSTKSADATFNRLRNKCKGKINPNVINKLSLTSLRRCGLSRMKALGLKDISKKMITKEFNPSLLKKMNDEDAITYLSSLRQIAVWSGMMILIFTLNRPNIWPTYDKKKTLDIGLLRAISKNYKKNYLPPVKFTNNLGKKFSPYCSVATMFLWRSIDTTAIQY